MDSYQDYYEYDVDLDENDTKSFDNIVNDRSSAYIVHDCAVESAMTILNPLIQGISSTLDMSLDEVVALIVSLSSRFQHLTKDQIIALYVENPDCELELAGIAPDYSKVLSEMNDDCLCLICYTDPSAFHMDCGHGFCQECFNAYLISKIGDGPTCLSTFCPLQKEHLCRGVCTYGMIQHLFRDLEYSAHWTKYNRFLMERILTHLREFSYCPNIHCRCVSSSNNVIDTDIIHCLCGQLYCFRCGQDAHDPCSCEQLQKWLDKGHSCLKYFIFKVFRFNLFSVGSSDQETATWVTAYTKPCPNPTCNTKIEKNLGCLHMICQVCKHEFCWTCMGEWRLHGGGFYKCNRYDLNLNKDAETAAERARIESERYMHYFNRFQSHRISQRYCMKLWQETELALTQRLKDNCDKGGLPVEEMFLVEAAEILVHCRRALMYTYVLGFYLSDSTAEKNLFEQQQALLEETTERLQELTMAISPTTITISAVPTEHVMQRKNEIVRLTQVVKGFLQRLGEVMDRGVIRVLSDTNY